MSLSFLRNIVVFLYLVGMMNETTMIRRLMGFKTTKKVETIQRETTYIRMAGFTDVVYERKYIS